LGQGNSATIAYFEARGIEWEYQFPGGEEMIFAKAQPLDLEGDDLFLG
jgi:hypothetical protein